MKIIIKNLQKKIPIIPKKVKSVALKVLSFEHIKQSGEITICFVDDKTIKGLNSKYLGRNTATDVLAFDISEEDDPGNIFADIIISTDTAIRNAGIYKTTKLGELYLYVIHGMLHILGYKDNNARNSSTMRKKEEYLCQYSKAKR
ncbi:MAG: rRNA maturation RNase YbeY [Candidatus Omnitrophica bacterium]|nr:rRNA maturation RNase YbeY [Candidatus Omnitrophota bacterium]